MMQQVAAKNSEVAALPFSASTTAKAVGTGIGEQSRSDNNQAFQALYSDAKSSNSPLPNKPPTASQSQGALAEDATTTTGDATNAPFAVAGKRDTSTDVNTDLPPSHTDMSADDSQSTQAQNNAAVIGKRDSTKDVNTDLPPTHADDAQDAIGQDAVGQDSTLGKGKRDTSGDVNTDLPLAHTDATEADAEQAFEQTTPQDITLGQGKRDATTDVTTDLPPAPTDNIPNGAQSAEIAQHSEAVEGGQLSHEGTAPVIPTTLGAYAQPLQYSVTEQQYQVGKNGEKLAAPIYTTLPVDEGMMSEAAKTDVLAQGNPNASAVAGDTSWIDFVDAVRRASTTEGESALSQLTPAENASASAELDTLISQFSDSNAVIDSKHDDALAITEQLLTELSAGDETQLSEAAITSLKALTAALQNANDDEAQSDDTVSLDALLAKFTASPTSGEPVAEIGEGTLQKVDDSLSDTSSLGDIQSLSDAPSLAGEGESTLSQELSDEEQLVLSLLNDALKETADPGKNRQSSANTGGEVTLGNDIPTAGESQVEVLNAESGQSLLETLTALSPQSAQKATEALAERIVSSLPTATSSNQQEAVKSNIIAGINEFQQQALQGREPGIDLKMIVEQAATDAGVPTPQVHQLTAQVDAQAGQFMQLMQQTQSAAQSALHSQLLNVDNQLSENHQLRSEASKTQQQFEGFDKAVNIHKPEGQQQLNEKIRWMVNARNTMAEIRLDPPELGSMQVRVNVSGDAASVSFIVQSQHAKEALADAMPRLRDMLGEQGIELADAQVRKDNSSQGEQNGQQLAGSGNGRGDSDGMSEEGDDGRIIEQSVSREAMGGIDYYA